VQRGIQRALAGVQPVLRYLLQPAGDAPAVIGPELEDAQDEDEVPWSSCVLFTGVSLRDPRGVWPLPLGVEARQRFALGFRLAATGCGCPACDRYRKRETALRGESPTGAGSLVVGTHRSPRSSIKRRDSAPSSRA
jgi:hypothetical protein